MKEVIHIESSLNKQQAAELRDLVQALVDAEIADSWKGGGDPLDIPEIEASLDLARARFDGFVLKLVRSGE